MAKHHRHTRRRHNPFGLNSGVVKDAAFNTGGALAALYLSGLTGLSGWAGVLATAGIAVGEGMVGKALGPGAAEELLKGGLTAAIIQALKQLGVAPAGLGLYTPGYFALPTSSDQYLRTLKSPYPQLALPAAAAAAGAAKGMHGYRFRSRFAGNY
jgi:hypothetical protein